MILLYCVSKQYCVLLPAVCSDISCCSLPYKPVPSIALFCVAVKMLHQSIMTVPHISADHLVLCLNFPLPSVSPDIRSFFIEPELCIVRPIYLNLPIMTKVSRECLGIIWLVTDAFIFLAVHGIISFSFICFPLHLYSTAGKTVFYSSLTFVLVETSKSFPIFVKFCHC